MDYVVHGVAKSWTQLTFMSGRASRDREQGRDARGKDRRIERKYGRKPTG